MLIKLLILFFVIMAAISYLRGTTVLVHDRIVFNHKLIKSVAFYLLIAVLLYCLNGGLN